MQGAEGSHAFRLREACVGSDEFSIELALETVLFTYTISVCF
jgi:hypothetical protein